MIDLQHLNPLLEWHVCDDWTGVAGSKPTLTHLTPPTTDELSFHSPEVLPNQQIRYLTAIYVQVAPESNSWREGSSDLSID